MGILKGASSAKKAYDVVVVGSGSAGCAAVRAILEKSPRAKVALVERGDFLPRSWWYTSPVASHLLSGLQRHAGVHKATGRSTVVGGNSALTGGPYLFGHPDEFDALARDTLCNELKWSSTGQIIKDVGAAAGLGLPDRSQYCSELNGLMEVACGAGGVMGTDLLGGGRPDGYAVKPTSAPTGSITSSFESIVVPLMTTSAALDVVTGATCTELEMTGDEVVGVKLSSSGGAVSVSCGRVVLCGGCLETPTLLHGVPALADLPIGASVVESFSVAINFLMAGGMKSKSICPQNFTYMWRQLQEYRSMGSGAFTSLSECAAFLVSNDQAIVPDLRLDLYTGAHRILPAISPGFTVDVVATRPQTRGHISKGKDGVRYVPAAAIVGFDVRVVDEGVKWATLLCSGGSELRSRSSRNEPPFRSADARLESSIQTMEDVLKLLETELRTSGDVYGGCAMGSVVDSSFQVKGVRGLFVGDCSVLPGPHSGTRNAVGLITGTLAGGHASL